MRRNAELEAKSGKAAKNATMILNSTTTMYKENSFLDNFRATSGPETIDSSAVTENADNAYKASNTTTVTISQDSANVARGTKSSKA